jgi:tetratricopeptide (TPR) repeat protein
MKPSRIFLLLFAGLPWACWASPVAVSSAPAGAGSDPAVDAIPVGKPPEDPPLNAEELKHVDYVLHHKGEAGWESEVNALTFRQKKFIDLYARTDEHLAAGRYSEAIADLQKILRSCPEDGDSRARLSRLQTVSRFLGPDPDLHQKGAEIMKQGIVFYVSGDTVTALYRMAYSLSLNPAPTFRELFNHISSISGRTVEIEWNSPLDGVEQKLSTALLAFRAGDYMKAVSLSREALLMDPNNILAYKRMGSSLYAIGDYDKAISAWSRCLELSPHDPERDKISGFIHHAKEKIGRTDHDLH